MGYWGGFTRARGEGEEARGEEWSSLSRPRAGGGNARGLAEAAPCAAWTGLRGWERGGNGARLGRLDLRRSAGRSGSAWSSPRMEKQSRGGDKKIQGTVRRGSALASGSTNQ